MTRSILKTIFKTCRYSNVLHPLNVWNKFIRMERQEMEDVQNFGKLRQTLNWKRSGSVWSRPNCTRLPLKLYRKCCFGVPVILFISVVVVVSRLILNFRCKTFWKDENCIKCHVSEKSNVMMCKVNHKVIYLEDIGNN